MSMHGTLSDMAVAAMTDERRDELRAAAEMVAAVFGCTRNQMVRDLIPGTVGPDTEAEIWALTYGETACVNHPKTMMTEMTEQPIREMADIPNREWYVIYRDGEASNVTASLPMTRRNPSR